MYDTAMALSATRTCLAATRRAPGVLLALLLLLLLLWCCVRCSGASTAFRRLLAEPRAAQSVGA